MKRRELREQIIVKLRGCRVAQDTRPCDKCGYKNKSFCRFYVKARRTANEILKLFDSYIAEGGGVDKPQAGAAQPAQ